MMRMTLGLWCNDFTFTHQIITHLITRPRLPRLQCSLYAKQLTFVGMATTVLNLALKLLPIKNSYICEITLRMMIQKNILLKEEICVYFIGRSKGVTPIPTFFNFMQFLGNIDLNIRLAASFSVGLPRLGNPGSVTVFDQYKHNVT